MSPIRIRRPLQFLSACAVAASLGGCAAVPLAQLAATQMMQPASPMLSMFQGWSESLQKMTGTTATR